MERSRVPRSKGLRPAALAEFIFRPEVAEQSEAWGGRVAVFAGRREKDADHVVAVGAGGEAQGPPVCARGARDLPLLAQVNVGFGRGEAFGGARLDFDEAERRAFVGDEVDLGLDERAAAVAPDAYTEVRGDQLEAARAQVFSREPFAAPTEVEVRRERFGVGALEERAGRG